MLATMLAIVITESIVKTVSMSWHLVIACVNGAPINSHYGMLSTEMNLTSCNHPSNIRNAVGTRSSVAMADLVTAVVLCSDTPPPVALTTEWLRCHRCNAVRCTARTTRSKEASNQRFFIPISPMCIPPIKWVSLAAN
ncbi:hypothetical protein CLAFUW4_00618 [Fulvia fulva]|uniref:Uncharacterized protein n=1 Tax=Passalora fulva TaxID=5499 RepID=A0A9Q8L4Q6_PASFU|nr:uncharacterized protein CLAFUR5_00617 [Fulvia fulva]KAK4634111.1 hypothetical protein CLAFUR4_00619 [Fulvia fulva]KAK4636824.1 hypothetical protein CLAFUR0_00620 [Fulvia fulva]UJO10852.1 hypothetical protein CLAFUR5_00617 [Fulvia fulva]WPV09714.1 hypothetical protein CLAFUW4_00618 [Fulvia fulva]WPV23415.1 hypothetical protein CLAFUW7_00623 [Fulvia fulva]